MTKLQRFLRSPELCAAHARHKGNPTMLPCLRRGDTPVEVTLPAADAREQIGRLNRAGVFCLEVERKSAGTRVVFAVPERTTIG
jgi:hypothetical protein